MELLAPQTHTIQIKILAIQQFNNSTNNQQNLKIRQRLSGSIFLWYNPDGAVSVQLA